MAIGRYANKILKHLLPKQEEYDLHTLLKTNFEALKATIQEEDDINITTKDNIEIAIVGKHLPFTVFSKFEVQKLLLGSKDEFDSIITSYNTRSAAALL